MVAVSRLAQLRRGRCVVDAWIDAWIDRSGLDVSGIWDLGSGFGSGGRRCQLLCSYHPGWGQDAVVSCVSAESGLADGRAAERQRAKVGVELYSRNKVAEWELS